MQATLRRLQQLEQQILQDPAYLAEQRYLKWKTRSRQLFAEFLCLFPKSCRKAIWMQYEDNDALKQVFYCLQSRRWPAVPIPLEVAQVYLEDSQATPYQRCTQCHLLLPLKWGIWRNTITQLWWQAPVRYFASCPA